MLVAKDLQVRAGARLLIDGASFQIADGDKVGLVGRNGAGKTTLTKILAGEAAPAAGSVTRTGDIGYLAQDPRTADPEVLARNRILSARGLDTALIRLEKAGLAMASDDEAERERAMAAYARAEAELTAGGGYAAEAEAARIAANLGLPQRVLDQPVKTLSGGQRRRVELARILFSGAQTMLLDEPTNHLDADSIAWLRTFLAGHNGGLLVISHDVGLLEATVNKVFHLDANRAEMDVYAMGWKRYLQQRETDEKRRRRERQNAERKADTLMLPGRQDARQGHQGDGGPEHGQAGREAAGRHRGRARAGQGRADPLPRTRGLRQDAAHGGEPVQVVRLARDLHRRRPGHRQGLPGRHPRPERGGQDDAAPHPGGGGAVRHRQRPARARSAARLLRAGARHARHEPQRAREHEVGRTEPQRDRRPQGAGSFLFSGDDVDKPASVLSGGEKTRLALAALVVSSANVLLLDEPTNNLDPASRAEVLAAIKTYAGAVVLVTHDEGAVDALDPDRVLLLPDGTEDLWSAEYADLISLA